MNRFNWGAFLFISWGIILCIIFLTLITNAQAHDLAPKVYVNDKNDLVFFPHTDKLTDGKFTISRYEIEIFQNNQHKKHYSVTNPKNPNPILNLDILFESLEAGRYSIKIRFALDGCYCSPSDWSQPIYVEYLGDGEGVNLTPDRKLSISF
jgi:hypothetical protein